jgi:hypothetical protein
VLSSWWTTRGEGGALRNAPCDRIDDGSDLIEIVGMAVYTTTFAATDAELDAAFPGWRTARATPVKKKGLHPLTKAPIEFDDWEPDDAGEVIAEEPTPLPMISGVGGDYAAYFVGRLPAGVRRLPYFAAKGFLSYNAEQLLRALDPRPLDEFRPAKFPPKALRSNAVLEIWPVESVQVLSAIAPESVSERSEQIAADEEFAEEGWTADSVRFILAGLLDVAKAAANGGRRLYLLTEV